MVFYRLTSVRSLARFLAKNNQLAVACGFTDQLPSHRTFTRRFKTLEHPVVEFARQVAQLLVRSRVISLKVVATDSSLIKAKGRPTQKRNPKVKPSDPDARWGWSRTKDWLFGYKLHLTSTVLVKTAHHSRQVRQTLVPLTWEVSSANRHDSQFLLPLTEKTHRLATVCNRKIKYSLADKGYDNNQNYQGVKADGSRLIVPPRALRTRTGEPITPSPIKLSVRRFLATKRGKELFCRRADVERLIGHLKDVFLVDPLPVMQLTNVRPYLALVNLAYLLAVLYNHLNGRSVRAIKSLVA